MSNSSEWYAAEIGRYVAAAVVMRHGKALVLRRRADDFLGGIWELPSGRMDSGETIEQALARELREETGLRTQSDPRMIGTFDYRSKSGRRTRQVNFVTTADRSDVELTEHDAAEWIDADQVGDWPLTEETRGILRAAFAAGGEGAESAAPRQP
ncbi:NUDIX domain-containing protein [Streptomyces sp. ACA25]|uniref:NUDIX hydrolase n=1 Tax=Streptomyces sp. ACA25 TaxID=3022596 RepID=UPI00230700C6|nr:NUDIX domain-containing protein [Streptomyces sp. ACA25]MDB1086107.1 NUDIX domain-containing protein [Streptomyces sp. ACA25]